MKKQLKIYLSLIIVLMVLNSCVEPPTSVKLIGRWQDVEYPNMEMEFTQDGRFYDYFYGEITGSGEFSAYENSLTLEYSPCSGNNCQIRLGFTVTGDTLIITDSEGDFRFKKVNP
ncbi:hypothetical protein ACFLXB_01245 [Chloroflexota bacterium]